MNTLHDELLVFDGLIIAHWQRALFEDMRVGGLTAANCTCCVWEGFTDTMKNIARLNVLFQENDDLVAKVRTVEDIHQAKRDNRSGIVLGLQHSKPGRLRVL